MICGTMFLEQHMKTKTTWYIKTILSSAALLLVPTAFAEEQAEPEIAICEGFVDTEIVIDDAEDGQNVDAEVIEDGELIEDEEVVVDEKETTDPDDCGTITIDWPTDWIKRDGENPEIFYMSANGGAPEENAANSTKEVTDQAIDKQAVVNKAGEKPAVTNVRRIASQPTAVKANGRVFLR